MAFTDAFDAFNTLTGGDTSTSTGFAAASVPSVSGFGTRQSRVPDERAAVSTRHLMHWLVPEGPIVEMYINPQSVNTTYKKLITPQRTKGGYAIQYWGEELTLLRLSGTTGTSGIEGINVLHDVYRNEQLAIDPFALFLAAAADEGLLDSSGIGSTVAGAIGGVTGGIVGGLLSAGADSINDIIGTRPKPSLAQLAFTVELYWSGEVYRGYFTDFVLTESVDNLGLFNYDISFTATQKRGFRQNFMPWHRSAITGPSNSNPYYGTPHSFGNLLPGDSPTPSVVSSGGGDIFSSIGNLF